MPPKDLLTSLEGVTVSGILVAIIWAALTKKIVSGWIYTQKSDECDFWKNKYLEKVDPPKP